MASGTDPIGAAARIPVYQLPGRDARAKADPGAPAMGDDGLLPLLRENAVWFCRLRWVVVGVLTAAGVAALFPRFPVFAAVSVHPLWPFTAATIVGALNLWFSRQVRRLQTFPLRRGSVHRHLWLQIGADLVVLTVVLHGLGGGLISAQFMYLFHIILACIVFPARESLAVVGLAAGLQLLSLGFKSAPSLQAVVPLAWRREPALDPAVNAMLLYETGVMLLIWGVIWYLASELSRRLRRRDRELALTNRRLEASLEERTAHMLQTTHQLKAPFAAIHAHAQLLLTGHCGDLTETARSAADRISVRCLALSRQIQEMLQLANLRSKGQSTPAREALDLSALVDAAVNRVEPAARQRQITFRKHLRPLTVHAVRDHLAMLFDNLIGNAVSYSFDGGMVSILCRAGRNRTGIVSVRDRGIGIPEDKLPRVFDDYFRTDQAVRHNRASTGLGLAIVRHVARDTGITLQVRSSPGWGSRFTAFVPDATRLGPPTTSPPPNPHGLPADRR